MALFYDGLLVIFGKDNSPQCYINYQMVEL